MMAETPAPRTGMDRWRLPQPLTGNPDHAYPGGAQVDTV